MIMKQYINEKESKCMDHYCPGVSCHCGCNVYHYEYNDETKEMKCVCNACGYKIGIIKEQFQEQNLKEGSWR